MDRFISASDATTTTPIVVARAVPPVETSVALQAQIERGWAALLSYRDISVNDTLLRVTEVAPESVTVAADIDYKAVVGARYCSAVADTPYQALSALALTVTSDNHLAFFVRDSGDWPHSYECVGWFVRKRFEYTAVKDFISDRVDREIGKLSSAQLSLLGHYQFTSIAECMVVYRHDVADTVDEVQRAYPTAMTIPLPDVDTLLLGAVELPLPVHHPSLHVLRALHTARVFGVTESVRT